MTRNKARSHVDLGRGDSFHMDRSLVERLNAIAESMDIATTNLVEGVLEGAIKTKSVERLARLGLEGKPTRRRNRRRGIRKWTADGSGSLGGGASNWVSGPWRLVRHGDVKAVRARRPADGWYLYGPDTEGWFTREVGRPRAIVRADEYIRLREEAESEGPQPDGG